MAEKTQLHGDERRALRLLAKDDAHEFQATPIRVLSTLVRMGLAERSPYTSTRPSGKADASWRTSITEKGRAAIQEKSNG